MSYLLSNSRLAMCATAIAVTIGFYALYRLYIKKPPQIAQKPKITVKQMYVYPIKSCQGIMVQEWPTTEFGFLCDRHWMVYRSKCGTKSHLLKNVETVDDEGYVERKRFVTQRENSKLALISVELKLNPAKTDWESVQLSAPNMSIITIRNSTNKNEKYAKDVRMYTADVNGFDEGDEVSDWLSSILSTNSNKMDEYRLLRLDPTNMKRDMAHFMPCFPDRIKKRYTSFVDTSAFSIISQSTLNDINARVSGLNISNKRFRMNLVVESNINKAYIEDDWKECVVYDREENMKFRLHCQPIFRCIIPNVNPESSKREKEVTKTLRQYRMDIHLPKIKKIKCKSWDRWKNKVFVGAVAVNEYIGTGRRNLSVGDQIKIVETLQ